MAARNPEDRAREMIDEMLVAAGWDVQNYRDMNLSAALGIAVREFPLKTGTADYLLYVDGRVIGSVEAKKEGHSLIGVEQQSRKYLDGLPDNLPHFLLPLPFAYESTGTETRFTNTLEMHASSRQVFGFHQPEELLRLVGLDEQVRSLLREMPELNASHLWRVQSEAISGLERSLADNRPRSLIQMATGSGKTFTAVNVCYRLIRFARARRILFLVDRNNLGKQTLNEFQQFASPYNGYKFTEEYSVQHLKTNTVNPASKVCITTIQRLFSMLQGDEEFDEANEEDSLFETELPPAKGKKPAIQKPMPVVYNPNIPIKTFDFIVIDECHRSIYNLWRQVLEYFDAFLIGLTATPTKQTLGFFKQNLVQDYSHKDAIADGVNVGYDVYRISTKVTKDGAKLEKEPGVFVPRRDRRTKKQKYEELDADVTYSASQLDKDVVNRQQIRLVIQTFRDRLPEIFPGREEVPKTLIFTKTDLHADDIVEIVREEFGRGNDFCQKITAKSHKPDEMLNQFRNSFNPRIAVTVDMIATGTDVKPLECLIFMRNVTSTSYFEQMKGRGCRVIDSDALRMVTPDAKGKTHFVIVDAVGVCESKKSATQSIERKPHVSLEKLLKLVAAGAADPDVTSTLGARLARLDRELVDEERQQIVEITKGPDLAELSSGLLESIDADKVAAEAVEKFELAPDEEPTDEQLDQVEQERMRRSLKPFHDPKLRDAILRLRQVHDQIIDEVTPDTLLQAGFDQESREKAQTLVANFRQFLDDHRDEIEALQILYSQPYRAGLRYSQVKELAKAIQQPPHSLHPERLWSAFETLEPDRVKAHGGRQLVDVIALVRHALDPDTTLAPIGLTVDERYQQWLAEQSAAGVAFTDDQRRWLDAIRDHIATSLAIDSEDLEDVPFNQIGGLGRAYELFGDQLAAILEDLNARLAA